VLETEETRLGYRAYLWMCAGKLKPDLNVNKCITMSLYTRIKAGMLLDFIEIPWKIHKQKPRLRTKLGLPENKTSLLFYLCLLF